MNLIQLFLSIILLFSLVHTFDFFDFLNDMGGESNGNAGQRRGDSSDKGDSMTTAKKDARDDCVGYVCPGSNECVVTPFKCLCPYGTFKYRIGDWYSCIQFNQIKSGEFPVKIAE